MILDTVLANFVISYPWAPQFFWFITITICNLSTFFNAYIVVILFDIYTSTPAVSSKPGQSIPYVIKSSSS